MSQRIEIPYGLMVAADGSSLEENEVEQGVLHSVLAGLVDDRSLGDIAGDLNAAGSATRLGREWRQADIFDLLPRVVEPGASIFRTREWTERPRELHAQEAR